MKEIKTSGRDNLVIPKRSFPIFLQKELRKHNIWSIAKWGDGRLTDQLIFVFRGKGALKVQMAKGDIRRDTWAWHGEVGKRAAMSALT